MKKKILSLLLIAAISASFLSACGNSGGNDTSGQTQTTEQSGSGNVVQDEVEDIVSQSAYSTQKENVFEINGQKYYNSGAAVYKIIDDFTFEFAELKKDETESYVKGHEYLPNNFDFSSSSSVIDNNMIYYYSEKSGAICRLDMSKEENTTEEILFDAEKVKPMIENKLSIYGNYTDDQCNKFSDVLLHESYNYVDGNDGFIYFVFIADNSLYNEAGPINYRVGRFAKNGSKIEFFEDVHAKSIAVKDDYIYCYDDGFEYLGEDNIYTNQEKCGIYKYLINANGSECEKLTDGFVPQAEQLEIFNGALFYIDVSEEGGGNLYSIDLNGGEPEKISEKKCIVYYIDVPTNILYYFSGDKYPDSESGYTLYCHQLEENGDDQEKKLYQKKQIIDGYGTMAVEGDYLYFNSIYYVPYQLVDKAGSNQEQTKLCGERLNLKTNEMEVLFCTSKAEFETDEIFHAQTLISVEEMKIEWKKQDVEASEDGLKEY